MAHLATIALLLCLASPAHAASVEPWRPFIAEASARFGVPQPWIERVMEVESRGRPDAVSRKGAMGLMQLMPGTWADMRMSLALGSDPYDPRDNILAGAFYLRLLYERFGYPGMFAAYNAGPERYADQLLGRRMLLPETRAYLAAITGTTRPLFAVRTPTARRDSTSSTRATLFFALSTSQSGQ